VNINPNSNPNQNQNKKRTTIVFAVIFVVVLLALSMQLYNAGSSGTKTDVLTTSEFVTAVENGDVTEVTYNAVTHSLDGKYLKDGEKNPANAMLFTSTHTGDSLNELMAEHPETKYDVSVTDPSSWMGILSYVLPLLIFGVLIWVFFTQFNQANNKQMQFGKTKAKKTVEERPKTKFSDVAGIDEAVEELQEVRDFLASPAKYQELGAKIPRGVLLVGPPGTGKTLLARAVAGEAGVPFFSISGSDFVEMFVGVGASRVRDLFEKAKAAAPAIIFIDEIDAVGRQRGAGLGGGHDEREQTLNQLLVEMDGFEDNSSVILIAATNRVDILDPALLRPGRFDRQIVVMRPDLKGREQILRVHSAGKPLAHSVDLGKLARMTPGFTGADLANLMNEAALLTARKGKKLVTMAELDEAMEREIAGPERKGRIMTDKEKRTIAYHESGHALVGHILENSDPVHKISIISRGQALGYTLSLPSEDRFLNSRNEMFDDLAVFLGGRVAEEIFCDDITTGASNDLERATKMARQMVTRYGMTDALGSQVYGEANHEVFLGRDYGSTPDYSEATAQRIDDEVAKIMTEAHDRAYSVLIERREQIDLMVQILLERETVEGEALEALLAGTWHDYIEGEDELLARKAEELRKQEEDDERRRLEAKREAEAAAAKEAAKQGHTTPFGTPGGATTAAFGTPNVQGYGTPGVGASDGKGFGVNNNAASNQHGSSSAALSGTQAPFVPPPLPLDSNQRYTLEDIFSGRVSPDELFEAQKRALLDPSSVGNAGELIVSEDTTQDNAVEIAPADSHVSEADLVKPADVNAQEADLVKPADANAQEAILEKPTEEAMQDVILVKPTEEAVSKKSTTKKSAAKKDTDAKVAKKNPATKTEVLKNTAKKTTTKADADKTTKTTNATKPIKSTKSATKSKSAASLKSASSATSAKTTKTTKTIKTAKSSGTATDSAASGRAATDNAAPDSDIDNG
jgi:cell division protease FtsH